MKANTKSKIIMLLMYTSFIVVAIFSALKASDVSMLNRENSLYISKESFQPSLSTRRIKKDEQELQSYEVSFSRDSLSHIKNDTLSIIMNKLTDSAFSMELNGLVIGQTGDMENGQSMMKNSHNHLVFDRELIEDENLLVLNTYAKYKTGIESDGIYITDSNLAIQISQNMDFYGETLLIFGIGFLVFLALLMVFIYFINKDQEIGHIYSALSLVFISIYFIDYLRVVYLPFSYLTFKKIFLSSLYLGIWFAMISMGRFLKNFKLSRFSGITAISFILMSLMVDNFVVYKELYAYWYITLVINFLVAAIYSFYNLKKSKYAFIFSATFVYIVIYAGIVLAVEYFTSSLRINSPLVYIVIFAAIPVLFAFEELTSKEREILHEKELRQKEYMNAITDSLTGAWNQRYLENALKENTGKSTIAMIDLDDFKEINDKYSHLAGDFILKEFTNLALSAVRKTDSVCRYGGDEFVIILNDCPIEQAYLIMDRLRDRVAKHKFIYDKKVLRITISIGIYYLDENDTFETAIKNADKQLYISKRRGKNAVSNYDEVENSRIKNEINLEN